MSLDTLFDGPAGAAWRYFAAICRVPRPSGHEEQIRNWLLGVAAAKGWDARTDAAGNVVIRVAGRGRAAAAAPLILQGHMDMVAEQNAGGSHDFRKDPIPAGIDGDWVVADGTTLGADNGVAMALALAVAEADLPDRVPLELLFTTDEERGLTGALGLDPGLLQGRRLLNLDSEEEGVLTIGCAGGVDFAITFAKAATEAGPDGALACRLFGLRGGHSGVNIHEGRGHAVALAGRILARLREECPQLRLHEFAGGNKKNAIPREVAFVVSGAPESILSEIAAATVEPFRDCEPRVRLQLQTAGHPRQSLPAGAVEFLTAAPNGVISREPGYDDLVRTSNSIGVAQDRESELLLTAHGRSSDEAELEQLKDRIAALAADCGATCRIGNEYPGWAPNPASELLQLAAAVYTGLRGRAPVQTAVHAGLEAGIIGRKLGTAELLSIGPTIDSPHCPGERLHAPSFTRTFEFLAAFVSTTGD